MLAFDTNILIYALNAAAAEHARARGFLEQLAGRDDVAVCELVLLEAYVLLRNPVVFPKPCSAPEAVARLQVFRRHPRWRLIDYPGLAGDIPDALWEHAGRPGVARRHAFDVRLALTLRHHGVDELATANTDHFVNLGFRRVWNPLGP